MAITDLAHQRHKGRVGHNYTACAKDRLHDQGGDVFRALESDFILKHGCDVLRQFRRVRFIERIAIGIGRGQVVAAGQQRFVVQAEAVVAVHRCTAKVRAVIALFQRQEFGPCRFAAQAMVLPRQTQAGFDRIRAARSKEHPCHAVFFKEFAHCMAGFDRWWVCRPRKGRIVGQIVQLFRDRLFHHVVRVAKVHAPQAAHGIHNGMAVDIGDLHTFRARDDLGRVLLRITWVTHRVPKMARVVFLQEVFVFHGDLDP